MTAAANICTKLETAFTHIYETRMRDVPITNPALSVTAVGFREWGNNWLGILVTPWFMNLMLLPLDGNANEAWGDLPSGTKLMRGFPAGQFEFLVGEEDQIGRYLMCSLFSPMAEFADHEAAVKTAEAAFAQVMKSASPEESSPGESNPGESNQEECDMRRIWKGDVSQAAATTTITTVTIDDDLKLPDAPVAVSRRDMLRSVLKSGEKVGR